MSLTLSDTCFIKKVEFRQAGEKSIAEVSVCQKKYNKDKTADPEFDWVRVTCWEPKPEKAARLKKGNLFQFTGQFSTRKYTDKAGVEKISMEVRASDWMAWDMGAPSEQAEAPAPAPRRPAADVGGGQGSDEPPFIQAFTGW